ncbi:MAG: hypothetical protein ABI542_05345 [Gemmatimonadota bacterium]
MIKPTHVLAPLVIVLCGAQLWTADIANEQAARADALARTVSALRLEHNGALMPRMREPLSIPMLRAEGGVAIDSLPDGLYIWYRSGCGACQVLHDSLSQAEIEATYLTEEPREALWTPPGEDMVIYTSVGGGLPDRLPGIGTPLIISLKWGRIVALETGVLPIEDLRRLVALSK